MSEQLPSIPANTRIVVSAPPAIRVHLAHEIESAIVRRGLSLDDLRQVIGVVDQVIPDDSRAGRAIRATSILIEVLDSLKD